MSDRKQGSRLMSDRKRSLRVGSFTLYRVGGSCGIRAPTWNLLAIPTLAFLRRGWWWWGWVGYVLIVRAGPFTLSVWRPIPYALARQRDYIYRFAARLALAVASGSSADAGE